MTAPAQLSNRSAARDSEFGSAASGPAGVEPPCETTPTRSLPAPPPPVLPLAPPARRPLVRLVPLVPVRLRLPVGCGASEARIPAPRLTRAVRLAAAAAVTVCVVGGLGWIGQAAGPAVPAETTLTQVGAGETVWDVAQRVAPKSDQRAVVERIRQLNGMASSAIQPGQQLQVPDED
jgi:hypothetical protein